MSEDPDLDPPKASRWIWPGLIFGVVVVVFFMSVDCTIPEIAGGRCVVAHAK
jgi:hypothetical protein